jgi:hypothetical protein
MTERRRGRGRGEVCIKAPQMGRLRRPGSEGNTKTIAEMLNRKVLKQILRRTKQ